jgi:two-component system NtrC family response regulator
MSKEKEVLLIVEDDPGLQKQMRWSFDAYQTLVAGDRESALVQLRRHEPPVVTLDLGLPPDPTERPRDSQHSSRFWRWRPTPRWFW